MATEGALALPTPACPLRPRGLLYASTMVKPCLALVTQARCLDWRDQWDADITALRKLNLPGCRLVPALALAALHPRAQKAGVDGPESPSPSDQAQVCQRDVSGNSPLHLLPSRGWKHYSDSVRGTGIRRGGGRGP